MEEHLPSTVPQTQTPAPRYFPKKPFLFGVIVTLLIGIGLVVFQLVSVETLQKPLTTQVKKTPTVANSKQTKPIDDFFLMGVVDTTLSAVKRERLPNSRDIRGVVEYNGRLWYSGDGSLIEYDPDEDTIVHFSDPKRAICDTNLVIVEKYLYVPCRSLDGNKELETNPSFAGNILYQIYKINPETYKVEKIFKKSDGLMDQANFRVAQTEDRYLWIATFGGVARLDTKTNHIDFYTKELGIEGTAYNIGNVIPDEDRIWAVTTANAYSVGGISLFNKATGTWKGFGPLELKEKDTSRLDFEYTNTGTTIKLVPNGIQVAFRDSESPRVLVEKRYDYTSGQWKTIKSVPYEGDNYERESARLAKDYMHVNIYGHRLSDPNGFTSVVVNGKTYDVKGRAYLLAGPIKNSKRYFLTGGSVDVLKPGERLPSVFLPLPHDIDFSRPHEANPESLQVKLLSLEDEDIMLIMDVDATIGFEGPNYFGTLRLWAIDTKTDEIIAKYESKEEFVWRLGGVFQLKREGQLLSVVDRDGMTLVTYDPSRKSFSVLEQKIAPTRVPYPYQ